MRTPGNYKRGPQSQRALSWARLSDVRLLNLRICDLGLKIEGTPIEPRIQQLYEELDNCGLRLRPHCWLSSEWFSPHEAPGIAIPFYLAHPRLRRLEAQQMKEVEGGTKSWCMQLLRHEAGHSYETAYRLARRKSWQRLFGRATRPYPTFYNPRPVSRNFVLHLDWWYAQSHPVEDFAETFAVWLRPGEHWRKRYKGWPALEKLEYVDELMNELSRKPPLIKFRDEVDPVKRLRQTLRKYYQKKQKRYGSNYPEPYDHDLVRLFPLPTHTNSYPSASAFLHRISPELRRRVSSWTGESAYTISCVLKDMIQRSRQLDLRVCRPASELKLDAAILLTMQTMNFLFSRHHHIAV
ncbi:MAG TPA: putative zinc-binding metallopeptidase [Terriglobia bacterium]|nr:putative zinc-binding metallopeptidase [Terriglobia bacterium]